MFNSGIEIPSTGSFWRACHWAWWPASVSKVTGHVIKARLHFFILVNGFFIDLANLVLVGMPNHNHISDRSIEIKKQRGEWESKKKSVATMLIRVLRKLFFLFLLHDMLSHIYSFLPLLLHLSSGWTKVTIFSSWSSLMTSQHLLGSWLTVSVMIIRSSSPLTVRPAQYHLVVTTPNPQQPCLPSRRFTAYTSGERPHIRTSDLITRTE